ncbi:helix-turn-helix transcriptional regulator [Psychromonas aquimarina]|uniref:helix-turn-helix transcriptional regulator n=1 Tax=Psychromonas aquimarina TaxID=444919 RepID=UPI0003F61961|nr:PAS domain-containing protein [Psychromonas aquimarina]
MELRKLTKGDYDILNAMENVVDGIARMYGEYTEVVLHSLDINSPSVLKIANGHVTDRETGAPITNIALLKLKDGKDVSDSYMTKSATGKTLRSITTIVRNPKGKAIGLLCINVDMDAPMQSFLKTMFPLDFGGEPSNSPETFAKDIDETVTSTIDVVRNEVLDNPAISPSKRNREVVTRLHELGIFKYKNSILSAAKILGVSRDTVYLYLREMDTK